MLAKDTSHKTVFPVFTAGGGFGMKEMEGAADVLMVADPDDLPRAAVGADDRLAAVRPLFHRRPPGAVRDAASLSQACSSSSAKRGYDFVAGLEVEFHVFKLEDAHMAPEDAGQPGTPPSVSLLSHGYQYLTEQRYDQMEPALEIIRRDVLALGLPLRSVEVEFGPSQCEFTFRADQGPDARRQHGAVPQRREADRPPPRLSRHLHVPAENAERDLRPAGTCISRCVARRRRERLHGRTTTARR